MRTLFRLTFVALMLLPTIEADAQGRKRMMQNSDDAFANLSERFTLRFFDATNGKPIPAATVTFEGKRTTTDAEGAATFAIPKGLSAEEQRTVLFEHPKYVRTQGPVTFLVGTVWFNRFSVSPVLKPDRLRVVLDWSASPADLDAHLVKKNQYHLSYRETRKIEDIAWLDRDDQDGYGPETVTVLKLDPNAHYTYYVHDYTHRASSGSAKLAASRAHVRIYSRDGLLHTFTAPRAAKGSLWKVFEIVAGRVHATGQISDAP
jgi:hypothetical protein